MAHQQSPRFAGPQMRDSTASTASGGFASIGSMLSSPYSEEEIIRTPTDSPRLSPRSSPNRPRIANSPRAAYTAPNRAELLDRVQSYEGDIHPDEYDAGYSGLPFDQSSPRKPRPGQQGSRPPTIVDFPEPTLASSTRSPEPFRHHPDPYAVQQSQRSQPPPQRPQIQIPGSMPSSPNLNGQYVIPALPCTGVPVSPHLAAPPTFEPPRSPFASAPGSRRSSIGSDSIKGYDLMKEKKALFREGQEELITPFSPRKGRQESGLRPGVRPGKRGVSGADFWKRFSVSVRMDQAEKAGNQESPWLNKTAQRNRRIKWIIAIVLIILVIIGAGIGIGVALSNHKEMDPTKATTKL